MKITNGTQFRKRNHLERIYTVAICRYGEVSQAALFDSLYKSYTGKMHLIKDTSNIQPAELQRIMGGHPELFELIKPDPPLLPQCKCGNDPITKHAQRAFWVKCGGCGAETPFYGSEREARNCWHRMMGVEEEK